MRELFLLDPTVVFLNHGSFGACPRPVFDRYLAWQRELEAQPVEFLGRRYDTLYQEARDSLGDYLGTAGTNLVFVPNATHGINIVGRSLAFQPGDEILTSDHEYGALELMWRYITREKGIHVVHRKLPLPLSDPGAAVEAIWEGVTDKTRVIFLSHITSPTALILPVQEICRRAREAGILTIIDGAHVPGHIALNLEDMGADFYSGNCHKWLCAPKGSAFLYARPEHHHLLDPLVISWGWDGKTLFNRTSWQGTQDIAAYLTVPDAIRFQQQHDWDAIRARCHELVMATAARISEMSGQVPLATGDFYGQMAAVPLPPGTDAQVLKARLYEEYRVEVPIIEHDGRVMVRVSIQGYNTPSDAEILLSALGSLLG